MTRMRLFGDAVSGANTHVGEDTLREAVDRAPDVLG